MLEILLGTITLLSAMIVTSSLLSTKELPGNEEEDKAFNQVLKQKLINQMKEQI